MNKKMIPAIDIFSGAGGLSCGLYQSGFEIRTAVEINKEAIETYKEQPFLKKTDLIEEDVRRITGNRLLESAKLSKTDIYLLAGCPPCQTFSMQNRTRKSVSFDKRKELLFEFLRIVKEITPPFILMENVPGLVSGELKSIFNDFLNKLRDDYHVIYEVLNAADYGVPQKRRRLVLHAVRKDIYTILKENGYQIEMPAKTHSNDPNDKLIPWIKVSDVISDLPTIKAGESSQKDGIYNHVSAKLSLTNLERIRIIRANGGSRSGLPERLVLKCHKNYSGHKDVYGIIDSNEPAPTLTGGCLSYSKGRFGHPSQDRALSAREAARIQTFPDDFAFKGSLSSIALQIGNAVPVKLVKMSGIELKKIIDITKELLEKYAINTKLRPNE